jgi:hypothetical protein
MATGLLADALMPGVRVDWCTPDPATAASVTYAKHAQRPWCRLSLDVRSSVRGRLAIDMVLRADVALSMLPQPARHVVPSGRATCTVRSRGTR